MDPVLLSAGTADNFKVTLGIELRELCCGQPFRQQPPRCHLQKCRATARASFARAKEGLQETLGRGTSRKDLAADQAREEHRLCRVGVERPDHDDVT